MYARVRGVAGTIGSGVGLFFGSLVNPNYAVSQLIQPTGDPAAPPAEDHPPAGNQPPASPIAAAATMTPEEAAKNMYAAFQKSTKNLEDKFTQQLEKMLDPKVYQDEIKNGKLDEFKRYVVEGDNKENAIFY